METDRLVSHLSGLCVDPYQGIGVVNVCVGAYDVNVFVAGVPAVSYCAAVAQIPDKVVQSPVVRVAVVHDPPELLEILGAALAPPEPLSVEFVEGPPDNGHTGILQFLQSLSALVHAGDESVVLRSSLGERSAPVQVGVHSLGMAAGEIASAVPADRNDSALLIPGLCSAVTAGEVIAHVVKASESRVFSACSLDDVELIVLTAHPSGLLLSGDDVVAVGVAEIVVERLGFCRSIGV